MSDKRKTPFAEAAIRLDGIGRAKVTNVSIAGADVGLDFRNMGKANVRGLNYIGDGQAFVGQNIEKLELSDIRVGNAELVDLLRRDERLRAGFEVAAREVQLAKSQNEAVEVLKETWLGRFLAEQGFVEWASLAVAILSLAVS
ncbi:hypothetical protein [Roseovarius sp. 2305UL8-3]|uniref:hypothetical protein n=1 Tax=Roseovarius conchicola TaxID=3121636 RepID=UPI003526ECFA